MVPILLPQTGDPEKDAALVRQLSDATQQHYADLYRRQKELTWRQWQGTICTVPPDIAAERRPVFEFAAQYIATWELGSEARKESFPQYFHPDSDVICCCWGVGIVEIEEFEDHMLVVIRVSPKLSSLVHTALFTPQCSVETWKLSSDSEPVCLERRLDGPGFLIRG
jgi:pullulanase/glycogen debranching enzyme